MGISLYAQDHAATLSKADTLVKSTHTLGTVEVVAAKEQQDIFKLPMRSMQISGTSVEQQQLHSLRALSTVVPNLFMPDYGSKLTAPIYIRGIGSRINNLTHQ